eukprot:1865568-Prymnesium_polylepis.1
MAGVRAPPPVRVPNMTGAHTTPPTRTANMAAALATPSRHALSPRPLAIPSRHAPSPRPLAILSPRPLATASHNHGTAPTCHRSIAHLQQAAIVPITSGAVTRLVYGSRGMRYIRDTDLQSHEITAGGD